MLIRSQFNVEKLQTSSPYFRLKASKRPSNNCFRLICITPEHTKSGFNETHSDEISSLLETSLIFYALKYSIKFSVIANA